MPEAALNTFNSLAFIMLNVILIKKHGNESTSPYTKYDTA